MTPWQAHAHEIACALDDHFIVRRDVWGRYWPSGKSTTEPWPESRRGKDRLTLNILHAHATGDITIGGHSTSRDDQCLWNAWDIDRHCDEVDAGQNWQITLELADVLAKLGIEALIEDSNGRGGYHVWSLWSEPIPSELAHRFGRWAKQQAGAPDLESFPKQPAASATPGGCGNYLRLPGRHHKRPHWSRFYDQDAERWLDDAESVDLLIAPPVNSPELLEDVRPLLPPPAPHVPPPQIINPGVEPVCIADILANSIRRTGDRNLGLLTLARYWKAAGIPQSEAVRRGVAWVRRIPRGLTTADLNGPAIEANVASVLAWVYTREAPFDCHFAWTIGTPDRPVTCNLGECRFVHHEMPERRVRERPVPTVEIASRTEVPLVCIY